MESAALARTRNDRTHGIPVGDLLRRARWRGVVGAPRMAER